MGCCFATLAGHLVATEPASWFETAQERLLTMRNKLLIPRSGLWAASRGTRPILGEEIIARAEAMQPSGTIGVAKIEVITKTKDAVDLPNSLPNLTLN